jgi:hypothetical protein
MKYLMKRLVPALVLGGILWLTGTTAYAVTYGPDCGGGNCFGSIYTLTSTLFGSTSTTETHDFTLSVNTANYNGPGTGLDAVAIKTVSKSTDIVSSVLVPPPATFSAASVGGLSATGCGIGGSSGFTCTQSSNLGGVAVPNGTYAFTFRNTIATGSLLNQNEWSIKGLYVHSDGQQAGLTSVTGGSVPVPGTLLLFGVGFAALIAWQWMDKKHFHLTKLTTD